MSDTFTKEQLAEIRRLVNSPVFDRVRQANEVAGWRNEVKADWLSNFYDQMNRQNVEGHLINEKTGQVHTVESMVAELADRVKLHTLTKEAGHKSFPLSKVALNKILDEKVEDDKSFLDDAHAFIESYVKARRGYVVTPSIIEDLRQRYDTDKVLNHLDEITKIIEKIRKKYPPVEQTQFLSAPDLGQPQKLDLDNDDKRMFKSINLPGK